MPAADADLRDDPPDPPLPPTLPFSPITRSHILHCSVHFWHPLFRALTPKTRLVPLSSSFIDYLSADGIVLPADEHPNPSGGFDSEDEDDDDDDSQKDPSLDWPEVHAAVRATILELGGHVHPKLNWSAPKDATWISATNSMECISANEIYLLLKSSDFISHDLTLAFSGCSDEHDADENESAANAIPYHLVLRKSITSMMTSMEFRCFAKGRTLVGICQRELNHYDFLPALLPTLQQLITEFFETKLRDRFPDPDFVFDLYIPHPEPRDKARVWLIDINPWAPRTDPLLFSWMELLSDSFPQEGGTALSTSGGAAVENGDGARENEAEEEVARVEFRIVKRDDPEAYSFTTPLYSAHKLPREVVEAGMTSGGIREFIERWKNVQLDDVESDTDQEA